MTGLAGDDTATLQLLENTATPTYGFEMKYDGDSNKFEINRYHMNTSKSMLSLSPEPPAMSASATPPLTAL